MAKGVGRIPPEHPGPAFQPSLSDRILLSLYWPAGRRAARSDPPKGSSQELGDHASLRTWWWSRNQTGHHPLSHWMGRASPLSTWVGQLGRLITRMGSGSGLPLYLPFMVPRHGTHSAPMFRRKLKEER